MHVSPTVLRRTLAGLLLLAPFAVPSTAESRSVDEIVARSIEASGGEAALARIQSVTRSGSLSLESEFLGSLSGVVTERFEPGRRGLQKAEIAGTETALFVDRDAGWEVGMMGIREMAADQRNLHWTNWQANVLREARERADDGVQIALLPDEAGAGGQPHHVLEIRRPDGTTSRVLVDRSSYLIAKLQCTIEIDSFGTGKVTMELGQYAPVDGVMLPRSWKQTIEGLWEITMTFDQVALEAALDDALFVRPAG
jgi:hypothetical protein